MVEFIELSLDSSTRTISVFVRGQSIVQISVFTLDDYINNNSPISKLSFSDEGPKDSWRGTIEIGSNVNFKNKIFVVKVFELSSSDFELIIPKEELYKKSICYLNEFNTTCTIPKEFINYILATEYIYKIGKNDLNMLLKCWNSIMFSSNIKNNCTCDG